MRTEFRQPMLATLTDRPVRGPEWVLEVKFDGVRCLASRIKKRVSLFSRNQMPLNSTYPEIAEALARQSEQDFIVDGEIVAFGKEGLSSFMELQKRMKARSPSADLRKAVPVYYYLFDLLHLDGKNLTGLPLLERKELLAKRFRFVGPVRYSSHLAAEDDGYYEEACRKHWEGLIAKKADSPYLPYRSDNWLKIKCGREQEFVIGGWTEPGGTRSRFGALLLGYYAGRDLLFAGKVGTGFNEAVLDTVYSKLKPLESEKCPFNSFVHEKGAHWSRPKLIGEIAFTEWTRDGKLRHPVFKGLRADKSAREIVREKIK